MGTVLEVKENTGAYLYIVTDIIDKDSFICNYLRLSTKKTYESAEAQKAASVKERTIYVSIYKKYNVERECIVQVVPGVLSFEDKGTMYYSIKRN